MAWTTPLTAVSSATLTAAQWNATVRDDLLETFPAKATAAGQIAVSTGTNAIAVRTPTAATVITTEGTASTTYVDLTTAGPSVTVTTGTQAIVMISSGEAQNTLTGFCNASVVISGASSVAAGTGPSVLNMKAQAANGQDIKSLVYLQTGLTAGSNTFKMQYNAGNNGGTATFFNRHLLVIPL